jgi:ribosomal protein S18 acetylase RimI-like enzyme
MKKEILIRRYEKNDEAAFFEMIEREGAEWIDYWGDSGRVKYKEALANSISYLLFEDGNLCGYARCRDDYGFGIYIYDLLIEKQYRGNEYGRILMEKVHTDHPGVTVYVMSDVDLYYTKLGYEKEGTIFSVKQRSER